MANIVFNKAVRKVIEDTVNTCPPCIYRLVLLTCAEGANKAQPGVGHLPHQAAVASRDGQLACQRSRGLGHDVRVVGICGVQSPLRAEPTQPTEQGIGAPLRGGWSCL
jgi:hypothetical protein